MLVVLLIKYKGFMISLSLSNNLSIIVIIGLSWTESFH